MTKNIEFENTEQNEDFARETVEHLTEAAEKYNRKTGLIIISPESYKSLSDNIRDDIEKQAKAHNCDLLKLPAGTYNIFANTNTYKLSDDGNAKMVLDLCTNRPIIYHSKKQLMYVWTSGIEYGGTTGGHWAEDTNGSIIVNIMDDIAKQLADAVNQLAWAINGATEAAVKEIKDIHTRLSKRYAAFANVSNRKGIIKMIEDRTAKDGALLDNQPESLHLISCRNGMVDVRTGQIRDSKPTDYVTRMAPVFWDPQATDPVVDRYLAAISNGEASILRQMAQTVGMAMDAETKTKTAALAYGATTNNGKTTWLNLLRIVLGSAKESGYVMQMPITVLQQVRADSMAAGQLTPELLGADVARIVSMSEPPEGFRLNAAKLKDLTGGGRLVINPKYKDTVEIEPRFTILIDTNYTLACDDPTVFRSNRIQMLPFSHCFTGAERDPYILDKLSSDNAKSALLRWIVEGAIDWHAHGWQISPEGTRLLADYVRGSDYIGEFLSENYVTTADNTDRLLLKDIYGDYASWCAESGMKPLNQSNFRTRLVDRGISVQQIRKVYTVTHIRRRSNTDTAGDITIDMRDSMAAAIANLVATNRNAAATKMDDVIAWCHQWWDKHNVDPDNQPDDWEIMAAIKSNGYPTYKTDGVWMVRGIDLVNIEADRTMEQQERNDAIERCRKAVSTFADEEVRSILMGMISGESIDAALDRLNIGCKLPF